MSCLNDPPRHFSCHDIVVLPVRYALCSDEESSLGSTYKDFTKRFCPAAEIRHHYYTLRLLRPETFLYAYIEGEEDIIQFTVGADSSLSKTKGVSSMLRADSLWLCVSNLDKSVWLAVSDADWTDEFMAEVRNDPSQFMQQFHPATGSSEKSLVFSSPDGSGKQFAAEVGRLVQEFRDKPGYLRALHEYTNELPPSEQAWRQQWTEVLEREGEDPDLIVPIEGWEQPLDAKAPDGALLRPHIVFFGEPVPMFERAVELVRGADVLIVAGTSLAVYPAASLVRYVRPEVPVYLVDPGNPDTAWIRNPLTHIRERSAVGMPRLVRELREAEHARQAGK